MSEDNIDALIECATILGRVQARKEFRAYGAYDAMLESSMHESIAKRAALIRDESARLLSANRHLDDMLTQARAEIDRLRRACSALNDAVSQTLGRALGYPRFCDDQKNFPGATDADGVCVGDMVAESLAADAATEIARLRACAPRWRRCGPNSSR